VFDYISSDPSVMFEQEPLRRLAAEGQLAAFKHHGFWQPMDTYQEFLLLNHLWSTGAAPWKTW
jgi:glucose-1-phosphate cytidylyltransferase